MLNWVSRSARFLRARIAFALGLHELDHSHLGEDSANRMRREQMRGSIEQMRVFLVGNTFFAPTLSYQAWGMGIDNIVIAWTIAMLAFSWALYFSWNTTYRTDGNIGDYRRFILETYANSGMWSLGMLLFYPYVNGDQKTILVTIMAGGLALGTVGFSRTPPAAFAFLGVQTVFSVGIAFGTGVVTGSGTDYTIALLALAAGGGIFNAVLERAKSSMKAFNDHEQLAEKSDVVDLLLKDYEAQATEWFWQTDAAGFLLRAPQQVLDMLGVAHADMDRGHLLTLLGKCTTEEGKGALERLDVAARGKEDFHDVTLPIVDVRDGTRRWIMIRGRPLFEGGRFTGYRGICADATATAEAKKQVEYLASHDVLTGLHNRNTIKEHVSTLNGEQDNVAVLLIDLDGFKQVNDSYGHGTGDDLLRIVARRLENATGEHDLVARLGGDEFLVMLRTDPEVYLPNLMKVGRRLVDILSEPYRIGHFELTISASIGLAQFPEDAASGDDLLIMADLALYAAKNGGRNQCVAFCPGMQEGMQKRMIVINRLKRAIKRDEILLYYQPQYSLIDDQLVGLEALARWSDAELGIVGPDIFIPIAEETGLIEELGEQLLRRACLDALKWPVADGSDSKPVVSVNLSPVQFSRGDTAQMVRRVIAETGLEGGRLEVEITEGVLISDTEKVADTLLELTSLGVNVALDDFGTGYSSLRYLRSLPLNRLKIDKSFVMDLSETSAQPIANSIIQLGESLGLSVIAEGVETVEQRDILASLGCHDAQGYLYSPPVPADQVEELIRASRLRAADQAQRGA